jgi:GMP synthase (glutamine-hydrolysing)
MLKAIAIRHVAFEDLGNLATVLSRRGYRVEYLEAGQANLRDIAPDEADLLVSLGGPISANQAAEYPFLAEERDLLAARMREDLPTLGICLGAQLMALALGATVAPGPAKEIGWKRIELTEAGRATPLRILETAAVLHWHGEAFTLPVGAARLGRTELCENQAIQVGRRGLALQFHPEATRLGVERWLIGHTLEIEQTPGVTVHQLREDTAKHAGRLLEAAETFWNAWLDQVEGDPSPRRRSALG